MAYDRLMSKDSLVTAAMVAEAFCRNKTYGSSFIKQTAQTAMSLPRSVINLIKEIADREGPEMCLQHDRFNKHSFSTVEDIMKIFSCRLFPISLYIVVEFCNLFHGGKAWIPRLCSNKHNTSMPVRQQNEQFHARAAYNCVSFVQECHQCSQRRKNILAFIKKSEWPVEMATLRENKLRCTELDEDWRKIKVAMETSFLDF